MNVLDAFEEEQMGATCSRDESGTVVVCSNGTAMGLITDGEFKKIKRGKTYSVKNLKKVAAKRAPEENERLLREAEYKKFEGTKLWIAFILITVLLLCLAL